MTEPAEFISHWQPSSKRPRQRDGRTVLKKTLKEQVYQSSKKHTGKQKMTPSHIAENSGEQSVAQASMAKTQPDDKDLTQLVHKSRPRYHDCGILSQSVKSAGC